MKPLLAGLILIGAIVSCDDSNPASSNKAPVSVIVTKIVVHSFPVLNSSGENWDTFGGKPDLQVQIELNSSVLFTSGTCQDISAGQACEITNGLPLTFNSPSSIYKIWLYDNDDFNADDLMGGYSLIPYTAGGETPSRIRLNSAESDIDIELYVTYQY